MKLHAEHLEVAMHEDPCDIHLANQRTDASVVGVIRRLDMSGLVDQFGGAFIFDRAQFAPAQAVVLPANGSLDETTLTFANRQVAQAQRLGGGAIRLTLPHGWHEADIRRQRGRRRPPSPYCMQLCPLVLLKHQSYLQVSRLH